VCVVSVFGGFMWVEHGYASYLDHRIFRHRMQELSKNKNGSAITYFLMLPLYSPIVGRVKK
jgi:hypothetical protein